MRLPRPSETTPAATAAHPVRFTATGVSAGLVDGQMILRCEVHEGQTVEVAFGPLAIEHLLDAMNALLTPATMLMLAGQIHAAEAAKGGRT